MKRHTTMTAHRWARAALPSLALGLLALAPVPTATASDAGPDRAAPPPVLTSVKARHVGNVDRVVFTFTGGAPVTVFAEWVDTLVHDGSGLPVRVAGAKVLSVAMNGAVAHDDSGSTVPGRTAFALPNVITAVGSGDFEGTVGFGLGVQKRTSYTVRKLQNPDRVVVDVRAGFPTTTRRVWFVDSHAVQSGNAPYFVSRPRPVRSDAPAAAALHAMFAGPTAQERAARLRLVRSHAWGFDFLHIEDGRAVVRLTRGCDSDGSTITVAGEITPTLRQFPSVDWVKIYGPGGATEQPDGPVDSIPACLEP